jgi:hypothetical protein
MKKTTVCHPKTHPQKLTKVAVAGHQLQLRQLQNGEPYLLVYELFLRALIL